MNTSRSRLFQLGALMAAVVLLPGCMVELLTTTAIQGELQAQSAAAATQQLANARRQADEMKLRQGIDVYRAENGVNPPSLQAMVPDYLDAVPVDPAGRPLYAYDPASGWFGPAGSGGAPSGAVSGRMTAQDDANLDQLYAALDDYYAMYGEYPAKLGQLAPRFIDAVPGQAVGGQPYIYRADTGEVYHPSELQAAARPQAGTRSSMPISGASPVAEQVQAIGIMNDLNAQTNPTAGRARQQVQDLATSQNEQYESLMNDLDL